MEAGRTKNTLEETAAGRTEEHREQRTTDSRIEEEKDVKNRRGRRTRLNTEEEFASNRIIENCMTVAGLP